MINNAVKNLLNETFFQWPSWSVHSFFHVSLICCCWIIVDVLDGRTRGLSSKFEVVGEKAPSFRKFQRKYLAVYFIVMLADWMQGTNMYTLYESYGVDIGTLFLTGFSSSAIFGTFLGLLVDKCGRRLGCIVFCVLEIVINILEHYPSMHLLLLGRLLGGISTSLLFTAFESWMVGEHRKHHYPEEWLASTFSLATIGNGFVAIIAGILAQILADRLGHIGPFQCAVILSIVALVLILFWDENYGREEAVSEDVHNTSNSSLFQSFSEAWRCIYGKKEVLLLGLIQSFFEGAMYTFVFMWVPTLSSLVSDAQLPTGIVFSSFMVCIAVGGIVSSVLLRRISLELSSTLPIIIAAMSMIVPTYLPSHFEYVLWSFFVLEMCIGYFYACSGLLRSRYIPEAHQGAIMNIFRIPLNALVVVGTKMTNVAAPRVVFGTVTTWFGIAAVFQVILHSVVSKESKLKMQ